MQLVEPRGADDPLAICRSASGRSHPQSSFFGTTALPAGGSAPQWRIAAGASPMASPTSPAVRVLQRLRVFTASWEGNLVQGWPWSDAPQSRRLGFFQADGTGFLSSHSP